MKPLSKITAVLAVCALTASHTQAEEGGAGHIVPGAKGTLIDLLPDKPGLVLETMYLHYQGNAEASRNIPVAGLLTLGLDARSDVFSVGGIYTFDEQLFGAYYSAGAFLPYVWADVEARVTAGGMSVRRSSSVDGIGDITLLPVMMAWQLRPELQLDFSLPVIAPTGDYDAGRLANPGMNHWTFDPTIGIAYSNEETGFNLASHLGFGFSTENSDTKYRNGTVFHFDVSAQQLLPLGPGFIGLGIEAFYVQQISDDRGSGATLGGFRGQSLGVGPVVSYILPVGDSAFVTEARWLPELDTSRRLEGDYFWLKSVYQF